MEIKTRKRPNIANESTNDKIDLKSRMKDIQEIQRQRKIAFERLATRQIKVEKNFDKFCAETRGAIQYFTDQIEDSDE